MFLKKKYSFNSEGINFELKDNQKVQNWIQKTITNEGKAAGEIAYVFCSDDYLHKINLEHLNHDTYTDIIAFNYGVENLLNADIFISIDRVKENAKLYKVSFEDELNRVIIHGVLHLVGYNDKTKEEQVIMREKEDFYLALY